MIYPELLGSREGSFWESFVAEARGRGEGEEGREGGGLLVEFWEIWSEMHKLADGPCRVAESGVTLEGLGSARQGLSAKGGAEAWIFLKHLEDMF